MNVVDFVILEGLRKAFTHHFLNHDLPCLFCWNNCRPLGRTSGIINTDQVGVNNVLDERMAFVFDTQRLKPSGLACELVVPQEWLEEIGDGALQRQFARPLR